MNSPKWTNKQQQVIDSRDCELLVSAAAGSGKTAVLVERIIQMITSNENPISIDKFLVVTFTNAAASQMRERISNAISDELEKNPNNKFLQEQMILLDRAKITTIHSFCLDVIRSNFHLVDIEPNFRIGDQTEINLLKNETLEALFEDLYEQTHIGFLNLVECYAEKGGDRAIQNLILQVYNFSMSSPEPEKWLKKSAEMFFVDRKFDFSKTKWFDFILEYVKLELTGIVEDMENAISNVVDIVEIDTFTDKLRIEKSNIKLLLDSLDSSWDNIYKVFNQFEFENYNKGVKRISKDAPGYIKIEKEKSKSIRDHAKNSLKKIIDSVFNKSEDMIKAELDVISNIIEPLSEIVIVFKQRYLDKKREKSIIDFNDIEHYALKILTNQNENSSLEPSEVALKYRDYFYEIFIDEYQDSNLIQEVLLKSIAKKDTPNRFMVGDVKQSIYRFRQSKPELFMEKYNNYSSESGSLYRKIQLYKNFRSRAEVVESINYVFKNIMSKKVGEIEYIEEEKLNFGAEFLPNEEDKKIVGGTTEIHLIEKKKNEDMFLRDEVAQEDLEDEDLNGIQIEARIVGKIINNLIKPTDEGKVQCIYDKDLNEYRPVEYRDIVILLRVTSRYASIFEEEFNNMDIPTFADIGEGYFETLEVKTILSLIQVIDNPYQDIPLLSCLKSSIFTFSSEDLINLRVNDRESSIYEAVKNMSNVKSEIKDKSTKCTIEKSIKFLKKLNVYRKKSLYMSTYEFLWYLYNDTGYFMYLASMSKGNQRQVNLRILFEKAKQFEESSYKGLFNFIKYIEKLKKSSGDFGSAKIIGESANVVRIMSIHKSKGLEFPIVICSGLSKRFNNQDFRNNVLMHQELGFGPQIVDVNRRISFPSLAKEILKKKIKVENLSEEMRVLYVAFTRAKEKLILTGTVKDIQKSSNDWANNLDRDGKFSSYKVLNSSCFLDWVMPTLMKHKDSIELRKHLGLNICDLEDTSRWKIKIWQIDDVLKKNDIINEGLNIENFFNKLKGNRLNVESYYKVREKLNEEYCYNFCIDKPSSISVTEVKKLHEIENNNFFKQLFNEGNLTLNGPKFMKNGEDKNKITNANRGSIVHLFMQLLDFKRVGTIKEIEEQVHEMVKKNIISNKESKVINPCSILKFFQSELGVRILKSNNVSREKSIYSRVSLDGVYKIDGNFPYEKRDLYMGESVMLRGVIDMYFEEDGRIILVDYKTDYVDKKNINTVIDKYRVQLDLYAKSLYTLTGKEVNEKWIYLFGYNKAVKY